MPKTVKDAHFVSTLTRVLTPLVRMLLRAGFTYPRLIQLLRTLYVDLAETEFKVDDEPLTTSRMSLLTGIARRYIREIRMQEALPIVKQLKISPGASLIADWVTHPRFTDDEMQPLCLPRLANQADGPSFEELANRASSDIRARTQLQDLVERKLVEINDQDQVRLLTQAYLPDNQQQELMSVMAEHLHDHISAVSNNVEGNAPRYLDRSAYQLGLSEQSVAQLQQLAEQEGMLLLKKLYAQAAALSEQDVARAEATHRFRLGLYTYAQPEMNSTGPEADPKESGS